MSFLKRLFKDSMFKCSNCHALIQESTYHEKNGMCGLCASSPEIARWRKSVAESQRAKGVLYAQCGKCGVYERQRVKALAKAEKNGASIYMKDWPALLFCDRCEQYFCGACQSDLGLDSGCPKCSRNLERPPMENRRKEFFRST